MDPTEEQRFGRQMLLRRVGRAGQERLLSARVAVVGCGALGSALADLLVRSGVRRARLIDRDYIELSNLGRQRLYSQQDIEDALPKAVAAARRLSAVDPGAVLEPAVEDLTPRNVLRLLAGVDLVLDGTDNFETRFLINDACHKLGLPWVYAGVVGTVGQTMAFPARVPPCFACYVEGMPPAGSYDTCDTAGVLGAAVDLVASLAAVEGLKLLLGHEGELAGGLTVVDAWRHQVERLALRPRADCPTCQGRYQSLEADLSQEAAVLCGRDAVQLPARPGGCDLAALAQQLAPHGKVRQGHYMLKFWAPEAEFTVFPDGRAILKGITSKERARALYSRYLG